MDQLVYSIAESAQTSRIGRTKIYKAINAGDLRAVKCGRRTIILHDDLVRYLQNLPSIKVAQGDAPLPQIGAKGIGCSTIRPNNARLRRVVS